MRYLKAASTISLLALLPAACGTNPPQPAQKPQPDTSLLDKPFGAPTPKSSASGASRDSRLVYASDPPFEALPEVIEPIQSPRFASGEAPKYSEEALRNASHGDVSARCALAVDGSVKVCTLLKCPPDMKEAVLAAFQKWRFSPALLDGHPIEVVHQFDYHLLPPFVDLGDEDVQLLATPSDMEGAKGKGIIISVDGKAYLVLSKNKRPIFVSGKDPVYTAEAIRDGVEGQMLSRCTIGADGKVSNCKVLKSLPHMEKTMIEALQSRIYVPLAFHGKPIAIDYAFQIKLKLPSASGPASRSE